MLPKTRQTSDTRSKVTVWFLRSAIFAIVFFIFSFFQVVHSVYAQGVDATPNSDQFGLNQVSQNISVATPANADIRVLIIRIINVILGLPILL